MLTKAALLLSLATVASFISLIFSTSEGGPIEDAFLGLVVLGEVPATNIKISFDFIAIFILSAVWLYLAFKSRSTYYFSKMVKEQAMLLESEQPAYIAEPLPEMGYYDPHTPEVYTPLQSSTDSYGSIEDIAL